MRSSLSKRLGIHAFLDLSRPFWAILKGFRVGKWVQKAWNRHENRQEINEKRRSVQDRLDELGEGVPLDTAERVQVMWTLVTEP